MTTETDIVNQALQAMGTRTSITSQELANAFAGAPGAYANPISNEAIQASLILRKERDILNRMAPWDCVNKIAPLTYITSIPGTPENPNSGPPLWQAGTPMPIFSYEYQYPVDCMRAIKVIPQYTSSAGGIPIYPTGVTTGASQIGWTGPALKFKIATDAFFGVTAAAIQAGGLGYNVGDIIALTQPTFNLTQAGLVYPMPVGAPVLLLVTSVGGGGVITGISVVNQVQGETDVSMGITPSPIGGSYFAAVANPVSQGSTTDSGTGATFNLTFATSSSPQRIILCNQESALLNYNGQVTDPNVMDGMFQKGWAYIVGARLSFQLNGDKAAANGLITLANDVVAKARQVDGNESITVNDVNPDWLRVRGNFGGPNWQYSPNMSFDWGGFYQPY